MTYYACCIDTRRLCFWSGRYKKSDLIIIHTSLLASLLQKEDESKHCQSHDNDKGGASPITYT